MKKIFIRVVLICVCIIFLKNQYASLLLQKATYGIPALIKKGAIEDLYIGSSMFRQGLDIDTMEQIQEDSYILAYNGNQPVLEYEQLEYLVRSGVSIKNLYVDMYTYSAWSEPKIQDEKIFLEIGIKEKLKIWKLISSQENMQLLDFWRVFISSNNELLLTWPINYYLINSQFYKGGTKVKPQGVEEEGLIKLEVPQIDGTMNDIQKEYLDEIIYLCQEEGINLYFIETPKYKKVAEDKMYLEAMNQYSNLLAEKNVSVLVCQSTYENIDKTEKMEYYKFDNNNAMFYTDLIHLSYEGRIVFTEKLSQFFV